MRPPLDDPLRLVLERALTLSGQVLDRSGAPFPEARGVAVRAPENGTSGRHQTFAPDRDGRFELGGLQPGSIELTARGPGHRPTRRVVELGHGAPAPEVVLQLEAGADLGGLVRDPDGRPVVEALVRTATSAASPARSLPPQVSRSDWQGRFRLEGLAPGSLRLQISHPRFLPARRDLELQAGDNHVEIELEPGLSISGVVLDGTGAPVPGAHVAATKPETRVFSGPRSQWTTDGDGRFEIAGLRPGAYRVHAEAGEEGAGASPPIDLVDGPARGVVIELEPGSELHGLVTGVDLDELAEIGIEVVGRHDPVVFRRTQPDFEGRFVLQGLPAGDLFVSAHHAREGLLGGESVTIERGRTAEVTLDLGGDGSPVVGIVSAGGEPAPNVAVQLRRERSLQQSTRTDQDGRFAFPRAKEGPAEIVARTDAAMAAKRIEIAGRRESTSSSCRPPSSASSATGPPANRCTV